MLLGMTLKDLEKTLYFEAYVVYEPGPTKLKYGEVINEGEYRELLDEFGSTFKVGMGAETIRDMLKNRDMNALSEELKDEIKRTNDLIKRARIAKRLGVCDAFKKSKNKPEWISAELRPELCRYLNENSRSATGSQTTGSAGWR